MELSERPPSDHRLGGFLLPSERMNEMRNNTTGAADTPTINTFDFNGITLRTVLIDGEPWFVVREVCDVLGLLNPSRAAANLTKSYVGEFRFRKDGGRANKMVNEAGLYALVMRSNKPNAKAFQKWVTGTVLPAIRKDGAYVQGEEKLATGEMSEEEFVLKAISILQSKVDRLAAENGVLRDEYDRVSIAEYVASNHVYVGQSVRTKLAHRATKLAAEQGIRLDQQERVVETVKGPMKTTVKIYPRDLLDRVTSALGLFPIRSALTASSRGDTWKCSPTAGTPPRALRDASLRCPSPSTLRCNTPAPSFWRSWTG